MAEKKKKINKGRIKEDWMRLHSRPAGPMARQSRIDDDVDFESEDFEASDEPFFFEENSVDNSVSK